MKETDFLNLFEEVIEAQQGSVKLTDLLRETSGWDSLAYIQFIAVVDQKLGKIISPQAIVEAKTVAELFGLVTFR
jgi:acyl carrier protein